MYAGIFLLIWGTIAPIVWKANIEAIQNEHNQVTLFEQTQYGYQKYVVHVIYKEN